MSAWRRRRVEESDRAGDGAGDDGQGIHDVQDVTVPDLFADRATEPSLADQEWPEPTRPADEEATRADRAAIPAAEETTVVPPVDEPTAVLGEPVVVEPPASRRAWLRDLRITSMTLYVVAFLCLLGAAGAVAVAQFTASTKAPWVSVGLSGAAVVLTVTALLVRSWP